MRHAPYDGGGGPGELTGEPSLSTDEELLAMRADANQYLGIGLLEFWEITPADLRALWRSFNKSQNIWNHRIGLLASLQYNAHRRKNSKAVEPHEWFASEPERKRPQTLDEIRNNIMMWAAMVKKNG